MATNRRPRGWAHSLPHQELSLCDQQSRTLGQPDERCVLSLCSGRRCLSCWSSEASTQFTEPRHEAQSRSSPGGRASSPRRNRRGCGSRSQRLLGLECGRVLSTLPHSSLPKTSRACSTLRSKSWQTRPPLPPEMRLHKHVETFADRVRERRHQLETRVALRNWLLVDRWRTMSRRRVSRRTAP